MTRYLKPEKVRDFLSKNKGEGGYNWKETRILLTGYMKQFQIH